MPAIFLNKYFLGAVGIGLAAFAIWLMLGKYNSAIAANAKLEADLGDLRTEMVKQIEEAAKQKAEADRLQVILAGRERARGDLETELQATTARIKELEESNEEARNWLHGRINPDVLDIVLSEGTPEGDGVLPAGSRQPDGAMPHAPARGESERRFAGVGTQP